MGNKRSRDLTRPTERAKPCTCDGFDLVATCENDGLVVSLLTDLPVKTRVTVAAHRLFSESDGHQWYWTCLKDAVAVAPRHDGFNGFVLQLTNDELDTKGLHMNRQLKREMKVVIATVPAAKLEVNVSAPTTSHHFGICNRQLTGKAVTLRPSGHSLERSVSVDLPPSIIVMKQLGL
jgi:hypothetical protein